MKTIAKQKTCRNKDCAKKFWPRTSMQVACSHKCSVIVQKVHCVIKHRVDIVEVKNTDTSGSLKEELQRQINKLVRLIDSGLCCVCCYGSDRLQAGHFHSVGSHPYLRFNLNNIHVQDHKCNIELTGNKEGFFTGLKERYGAGYASFVQYVIPERLRGVKLTKFELKEAISKAKQCIKELENRSAPIESFQERLTLRLIYNNRIGIYKNY